MNQQSPRWRHPNYGCLVRLCARAFTNSTVLTVFVLAFAASQPSLAQIKITYPLSRQVVQRDNNNQASVQIAGSYSQLLDAVEARVMARAAGQGITSDWTTLQTNPSNGQFNGTLIVKGGWYTIEVRGLSNGKVVATDALDRFGVGEVFAIMGHSNAQGSGCNVNGTDQCTTLPGPSDDRVSVIGIDQNSAAFNQYLSTADNTNTADSRYLPGLAFSQLTTTSGMAPFAKVPWLWAPMGDALVARINVPVLLYNAGFGGTNMEQTYYAAYNIPFQHSFVRYDLRMPYANVRNLMNLYVPSTGLRAVLVYHGANDRNNPTDSTAKYFRGVIDKMRKEFNKPGLGFVIALDSYLFGPNQNVRSALFQVMDPTGYKTFPGPDLDQITYSDPTNPGVVYRPDNTHLSHAGQTKAGQMWASAITDSYLSAITPYAAEMQPLTNLSCAPNNQLTLTQPNGYQPIWNTGSGSPNLTVGAGSYSARIIDAQHKVLFPPAVVVPVSVQPAKPSISSDNGTLNICKSSGLTLSSSYDGPNYWSTGSSTPSIVATKPGVYTLQAKHAVYGCLSDAVSNTIGLAPTDLNLFIKPSRKVVAVNDTVSYQLIVQNNSSCDAGRVTLQNRLPPNMTVISTSSSSLSVVNADLYGRSKMVNGLINQIPAWQSVSNSYVARVTAEGTYSNAAELITTVNPTPNATAANGTENGEVDEARTELQTSTGSSSVYTSPNLNEEAPSSNEADLSLMMQSSNRTLAVGQTVSFTLTITNRGSLTATNVGVRDLLPMNLQFVSSTSGMNANRNIVSVGINQIPPGKSVSVGFNALVIIDGTFFNKAQIDASSQPDFDSKPNNGYSNGEDDQASNELQTVVQN